MLKGQEPELTVRRTKKGVTIVVHAAADNRLEQVIQNLTNSSAQPDWERRKYDGLIAGVTWTSPFLNGERHVFTATAETALGTINLTIKNVHAGYMGTGSQATAAALAQLQIAPQKFLLELLCTRHAEFRENPQDSWKRVYVPAEFGDKYAS
jgi:hypothetical protein